MILVTGGAGFIGANFVLDWLATTDEPVLNLDALTYAGNLESLKSLAGDPRVQGSESLRHSGIALTSWEVQPGATAISTS